MVSPPSSPSLSTASSFSSFSSNSCSTNLPPLVQVPLLSLDTPAADEETSSLGKKGCEKRNRKRKRVVDKLLQFCKNGKLQRGCMKEVAAEFNISAKTVGKIWSIAKTQMLGGLPVDVQCKWIGNSGKKGVTVDTQKMLAVPFHRRKNMGALAYAMDVSKSTVQRWLKGKAIRRHSNAIKPFLCEKGPVGSAKRNSSSDISIISAEVTDSPSSSSSSSSP
ncbi:unnamed protein product [Cuscuta campestris]|uniref:DUF7769 domain-containing protein n=1 Tax=Cuscuta campestris TaxID=132261 RepID=A0A484LNI7_9ASTE|nr:unnamed protein product [Cuscuta campestris]